MTPVAARLVPETESTARDGDLYVGWVPLAAQPLENPRPTESAVIVAVPDAEPVVDQHRARFDVAASWGVPAHVTIVYPFVDPTALSDGVVEQLRAAVAGVASFTCAFSRTAWFDRTVLWLDPEPAEAFKELTRAVARRFPEHQPYGGGYGEDVMPHLTVAEARLATAVELETVEDAVTKSLPFTASFHEALLVVGTQAPASWGVFARLPLGRRPG